MIIDDVHRGIHKHKNPKRLGRGKGSGTGKTSGRGHKGAGSRRGYKSRTAFAGGQMPIFRVVAKRGFNNAAFADKVIAINLSTLAEHFPEGGEVSLETLGQHGLTKATHDLVKILGDGEVNQKYTIKVHRISKAAAEKIKAAGGSIELLN